MENPTDAREKIEQILQQDEYQVYYQPKGFIEEWMDRFLLWLAESFAEWFPIVETSRGNGGLILLVIIIVITFILFYIFFMYARNVRRTRQFRASTPLQTEHELQWTSIRHLNEAKNQENEQNYTVASRHLFLALLLHFHEIQWLQARKWKTNWDYYEELNKVNQDSAALFYRFALLFDGVTYGEKEVNQEQYTLYSTEIMNWLDEQQIDEEERG
ncbi:DUF4129 domain-containing protein [Bacillus alkalicellulosilyticus]|uniref:DUF4129 domain-containing protein n=1 Tax=Alkalihalobacterium alkalicellulosilyticum TaxID=1912214 RepID=UPI000996C4D1|nr:DUF4129 domain-containing protein [Bacillus alkalicellulosilyticus]